STIRPPPEPSCGFSAPSSSSFPPSPSPTICSPASGPRPGGPTHSAKRNQTPPARVCPLTDSAVRILTLHRQYDLLPDAKSHLSQQIPKFLRWQSICCRILKYESLLRYEIPHASLWRIPSRPEQRVPL